METLSVNYFAIVVGAVLSMVIGAVWYGPLFGKKWLEIVGATAEDLEARKKMQAAAGPLYVAQFVLTLFQVLVLAHLIADQGRRTGTVTVDMGGFRHPDSRGCRHVDQ